MMFVATEQFTCLIFTKAGTQNDSDGLASGNVRGFADCNAEGTGKQGSQTGQQDKAAGQGMLLSAAVVCKHYAGNAVVIGCTICPMLHCTHLWSLVHSVFSVVQHCTCKT